MSGKVKRVRWNHHNKHVRLSQQEIDRRIEEYAIQYRPKVIEQYVENGIVIKKLGDDPYLRK